MKNMEAQKLVDGRVARMQSFPETADQFCSSGQFEVDDQNRSVVESLCKYVDNNITGNLDIRKGLLLMGTMGTGKTIMMQTLAKLTLKEKFRMISLVNVAEQYNLEGAESFTGFNRHKSAPIHMDDKGKLNHICLDDLGRERPESIYMGARCDVGQHLIYARYNVWKNFKVKTHYTSNICSEPEMIIRYGALAWDRLKEMCNIVIISGESRRK
jgi:DNA replication protein DnaC